MSWVGSPDMEHEVFVPVLAARLRDALADPARVARAVPGLHQEAGAEPGSGRLKVRVGGHSVTCRGTVRVSARADGAYVLTGDATEARGSGTVRLALTVRVEDAEGGAAVTFTGTATADGRLAELPPDAVASAATRLLDRFARNLGTPPQETPRGAGAPDVPGGADDADAASASEGADDSADAHAEGVTPEAEAADADTGGADGTDGADDSADADADADADAPHDASATSATPGDAPTPGDHEGTDLEGADPERTDPEGADVEGAAPDAPDAPDAVVPLVPVEPIAPGEPPAEAAHARRTMIGRSAEEVDHAPPRGRYAPVPAPQTIAPGSPLRWAAPAAAVALASAIVVTRALRRRR